MKRPISPAYTFTPGSSTLNLSGISSFVIGNLFAVINLKTGALIYAPLAGYGYSALSGTTLTLAASMAGMSGSDALMIIYDDGGKPAEDASVQAVVTAITTLISDVASNHADLTTLHGDLSTTLHADLQSILSKLGTSPAQSSDVAAVVTKLGAAPAQDATVGQAVTVLGNILTALGLLGTDADVQATTAKVEAVRALLAGTIKVDPSAVTSPVSAAALPLPNGAATENTLSTIKSILAAQASIAESTWYDPTVTPNLFYFRRVTSTDGVISETWTDPSGTTATFSANWKPLSSTAAFQVLPAVSYDCVTAATGMSVTDVIVRVIILNLGVSPPAIAASLWLNANTGAVLSSVTMANLKEVTHDISIPDGYDVTFGAQADGPLATPATAGSYMGTFRGFWTNWLARVPVLGAALANASTPVALATDQLSTLAKDGTDATGVTNPGVGIRGWLSGIYNSFASTVNTALGKAFRVSLVDPTTGNASLVQAFHNSDNQAIGGTSYGLFTGGVDQLINSAGNLDRKRAVAGDGMAATGLSAEVPMVFNGTTYDRAPGDKTNGAWVNIKASVGVAQDGTDMTLPNGVTAPSSGSGIRGWLSASWVQLLALATAIGTQADAAATSATATTSLFGWIKWSAGNEAQAITAIGTTATREGGLPSTLPDAFANGASGKLGALAFVWQYTKAAAASLVSLIALLSVKSATGTLGILNASVPITGGPYGAVGFKLTGTSVQTISAFGTRDGTTYDVPLGITTEVAGGGSTSGQTLAINGAGPFFGYIEAAGCVGVALVTSAYTSGSLAAVLTATPTARSIRIRAPQTDPVFNEPLALPAANDPALTAGTPAPLSTTTGGRLRVDTPNYGIGVTAALPTLSNVYGTALGTPPVGCKGVSVFLPPGAALTYSIQAVGQTFTSGTTPVSNVFSNATIMPMYLDEEFYGAALNLYFMAVSNGTGAGTPAPTFRWK